ncbi:MAG: hypothetical protein ACRCTJ_01770, partial [Brevinema sp.]
MKKITLLLSISSIFFLLGSCSSSDTLSNSAEKERPQATEARLKDSLAQLGSVKGFNKMISVETTTCSEFTEIAEKNLYLKGSDIKETM